MNLKKILKDEEGSFMIEAVLSSRGITVYRTIYGGVMMNKLIEIELSSIISPYGDWFRREAETYKEEARLALHDFYNKLIALEPEGEYRNAHLHIGYLEYLIYIKRAIDEKDYVMVCNELGKLLHFEHVLQNRIYYNLINMLEEVLEIKGGD